METIFLQAVLFRGIFEQPSEFIELAGGALGEFAANALPVVD